MGKELETLDGIERSTIESNREEGTKHFRYDMNVASSYEKEVGCTGLWGPHCSCPRAFACPNFRRISHD